MIRAEILVVGFLISAVLDLMVTAARAALLHASLPRLLSAREGGDRRAERTYAIVQFPARALASLDLVQVVLRFALAGSILTFVYQRAGISAQLASIGILLLAALLLFWAEWIIETLVLKDAAAWAMHLTWFAWALKTLSSPLIRIGMVFSGNAQMVPDLSGPITVTEEDLRTIVDAGEQGGLIEHGERDMIRSIFDLGDTLAREIMVPRIDMLALDVNTSFTEAVDAFLKSGHSRVPIYEESVDHILGLLYAKDLLRVWREGEQLVSLRTLLRSAYFVPEAKKVDELMAEMQSQRVHMAVVVDEYGGVAGLVTLEDIVEEILGEIMDEYDQAEELPFVEVADGEYVFLGRVDLDDFNDITASSLPKDEADTLAGFIFSRLGRVPASGESLQVDDLTFKVEQVSGRRIRKVRVQGVPPAFPGDERANHGNE